MTRWNPNLYLREGRQKGYARNYLSALIGAGKAMDAAGVPVVFSLSHLANYSRTRYSDLHAFVARTGLGRADYPYKNFTIKKRSGGRRWISVPAPPLMAVQDWIAQNILNKITPHPAACAYVIGRSTKDHAARHCAADWVVKVDITDFFSNISERQVYDLFLALGYTKLLSFEMARLCTRVTPRRQGPRWTVQAGDYGIDDYQCRYIGSLPQGAPTSPALSNLVCRNMDTDLEAIATRYGATYSRYADDLCFSLVESSRAVAFDLKKDVSKILWCHSFAENEKKTRIIPPGARKLLTGLIVNGEHPTVPKEIRDVVRMHLYYCRKQGIPRHCRRRGFRSVIGLRNHLYGLIMYINAIDRSHGAKLLQEFGELPWVDFDL